MITWVQPFNFFTFYDFFFHAKHSTFTPCLGEKKAASEQYLGNKKHQQQPSNILELFNSLHVFQQLLCITVAAVSCMRMLFVQRSRSEASSQEENKMIHLSSRKWQHGHKCVGVNRMLRIRFKVFPNNAFCFY